jgi:Tat protein translocase TatB subunit
MFNLGFSELVLLGIIALIFIGPQQLPELARSIGRLLNELKRATNDFQDTITNPIKDEVQNRVQEVRNSLTVSPDKSSSETSNTSPELPVGAAPVTKKDERA